MNNEKDVLDGWCVYVERSSDKGSNSSDSDSIEIISEDEAGNYQIYSKNYFHPESNSNCEPTSGNNTECLQTVSEIKEYSEDDPSHFIVEEGKEAQEREIVGKPSIDQFTKPFNILKPVNICDSLNKANKNTEILCLDKVQAALKENHCDQSDRNDVKCNAIQTSPSIIEISPVVTINNQNVSIIETTNDSIQTNIKDKEKNHANEKVAILEIKSEEESKIDSTAIDIKNDTSKLSAVTTNENKKIVICSKKLALKKNEVEIHKLLQPGTSLSLYNDHKIISNEPVSSIKFDAGFKPSEKKARKNSQTLNHPDEPPKKPRKHNLSDDLTNSATRDIKCFDSTSVRKRKKHMGKKWKNNEKANTCSSSSGNEIEEALTRNTQIIESREESEDNTCTSKPNIDRTSSVSLCGSTRTEDFSIVALVTIVAYVIYLLHSTFNNPNATPAINQNDKTTLEDNLATIHDRYSQLVTDWEAKVLENAELDFQIALREKSAELSRASRQNISLPLPTLLSLPDCMVPYLLTHMFGYFRQYPPDITDLKSWGKSKFCVDLSLLLASMRAASYSDILMLLSFLASPSSNIDYQAIFDHYLFQQRIHIHDIIRKDYPEIYHSNSFYEPQHNPRPYMYCVSMQRFSVLKNRFAPEQENMAALLTLGERYVQNDVCLQAMIKVDGRSIDKLYDIILEVLLSRSLSTAITLDPSLLHDYYLELILSNEDNLQKLSRQLFKYNILAIQKFNLTMKEQSFSSKAKGKDKARKYKKNIGYNDLKLEGRKQEKFILVRDGEDEFLMLNKNFKKNRMKPERKQKTKLISFGKGNVELFYDDQLRKISNGYSTKVRKFLLDINKDLKHALCYPYVNDEDMMASETERNESLVRFIQNMCRKNVLNRKAKNSKQILKENSSPKIFSKFEKIADKIETVEAPRKDNNINENVFIDFPSNTLYPLDAMHFIFNDHLPNTQVIKPRISPWDKILKKIKGKVENKAQAQKNKVKTVTEDRGFILIEIDNTEEVDDIELFEDRVVPMGSRKSSRNDFYASNNDQTIVPNKVIWNPDDHVYRADDKKNRVVINPDNHFVKTSQDKKKRTPAEEIQVEETQQRKMNNNTPDMWILNKMANSFGLHDDNEVEDPLEDLNMYFQQETESRDKPKLRQRSDDYRPDVHNRLKYNKRYDVKYDTTKTDYDKEQYDRRDKVNIYDTIGSNKRERSKENSPNPQDKGSARVNAYDNGPNRYDKEYVYSNARVNAYDNRPNRYDKEYVYSNAKVNAYDNRPNRYDKEYVYSNAKVNAYDNRPNRYDKEYVYSNAKVNAYDNRPNRHDKEDVYSKNREERVIHIDGTENKYTRHVYIDNVVHTRKDDMDWWYNRRAKLRAKMRKKHMYPAQDNPEYQCDYLYE